MTKLSEGRAVRLAMLLEDCGQTVQTVSIAFKNGPDEAVDYSAIEEKIGRLLASAGMLATARDISWTNVMEHAEKRETL